MDCLEESHNGTLVFSLRITGCYLNHILIDTRKLIDIVHKRVLKPMDLTEKVLDTKVLDKFHMLSKITKGDSTEYKYPGMMRITQFDVLD